MSKDPFTDFSLSEDEERFAQIEDHVWRLFDRIRGQVDFRNFRDLLGPLSVVILAHLFTRVLGPEDHGTLGPNSLPEDGKWGTFVESLFRGRGEAKQLVKALAARGIRVNSDHRDKSVPTTSLSDASFGDEYVRNLSAWVSSFDLKSDKGWESLRKAFEMVLKEVSNESKDAGIYSTPKSVVDLVLDLAEPERGETVYDPCFGTGGFLAGTLRRSKHSSDGPLHGAPLIPFGVEIDRVLHVIGAARTVLAGTGRPKLLCDDAFRIDPKSIAENDEGFDLVLANPPFGKEHQEEKSDVNHLPIRTRNQTNLVI